MEVVVEAMEPLVDSGMTVIRWGLFGRIMLCSRSATGKRWYDGDETVIRY